MFAIIINTSPSSMQAWFITGASQQSDKSPWDQPQAYDHSNYKPNRTTTLNERHCWATIASHFNAIDPGRRIHAIDVQAMTLPLG